MNMSHSNEIIFSYAPGKIILGGEHAVLYGCQALALPLDNGIRVAVRLLANSMRGPILRAAGYGFVGQASPDPHGEGPPLLRLALAHLVELFGERVRDLEFIVESNIPASSGLGSSAAISVSLIRGIAQFFGEHYSHEEIISLALRLEKIFHGNPSGIDHTVITHNRLISFARHDERLVIKPLTIKTDLTFVVGISGPHQGTANMVSRIRERVRLQKDIYEQIFSGIAMVVSSMKECLAQGHLVELGKLMDINQGYLNSLGVSTSELEAMCSIARNAGALGAKLTGAGGGGAVIALVNDAADDVSKAFSAAGFWNFVSKYNVLSSHV